MSVFELDERGKQDALANAEARPLRAESVTGGLMQPADLIEPARGVMRAVSKGAALTADALTPRLIPFARKVDDLTGLDTVGALQREQGRARDSIHSWAPDPHTSGVVGQALNGVFDIGATAVAGFAVGGPAGAAALTGTTTGYAAVLEAMKKTGDPTTALGAGAIEGFLTAAGVALPASLGTSVLRNVMAYGPAINVAQGVTQRTLSSTWFQQRGFEDMAAQYRPFDTEALVVDAVLGAVFGGLGSAGAVKPSLVDAALASENRAHVRDGVAPGVPADPQSAALHHRAFEQALEALMRGEKVNVSAAIDAAQFVRREPPESMRAMVDAVRAEYPDVPVVRPTDKALPRGVRNNNPGNIVTSNAQWLGATGTDGRFVQFDSPESGIRALASNLLAYQARGLDTVEAIIGRWAPPSENNTAAYVARVAGELGVAPGAKLNVRDPNTLSALAQAIIRHENGQQPYPAQVVRAGVDAALTGEPIARPAQRAPDVPDVVRPTDASTPVEVAARPIDVPPETVQVAARAPDAVRADPNVEALRTSRGAESPDGVPLRREPTAFASAVDQLDQTRPAAPLADQPMPPAVAAGDAPRSAEPARRDPFADIPEVRALEVALQSNPALKIAREDGTVVDARQALDELRMEARRAEQDARAFEAVVNCFLRTAA